MSSAEGDIIKQGSSHGNSQYEHAHGDDDSLVDGPEDEKLTTGKNDGQLESFNDILNVQEQEPTEDETPPTDPMLFTWSGFIEKLGWVGEILRSPCIKFHEFRENSRLRRASEPEAQTTDEVSATEVPAEEVSLQASNEETSSLVSEQSSIEDVTLGPMVITTEVEVHNTSSLEESGIESLLHENESTLENEIATDEVVAEEGNEGDVESETSHHPRENLAEPEATTEKADEEIVQPLGVTADIIPSKVSEKTKKKFKTQVRAHVKRSYKSSGMSSLTKNNENYPNITPTVRRIDQKENGAARVVAVIGNSGYGKTTLMKRYADMAMGRLLTVNEEIDNTIKRWHPFSRKDFFKFVHFIDARYLPREGSYTASEFLLKSVVGDMDDNLADMGLQWLMNYEKSILFIIDEVDETAFTSEEERTIGFNDRASPSCILHNLIKGNLLPNAYILVALKCVGSSQLASALNADKTYAIVGFDHAKTKSFLNKKTDVWKLLSGKFPNLLTRSKVPLFLLYSSVAISSLDFSLDSIIGAMAQYLRRALCHLEKWESESLSSLAKLKKLAFQATLNSVLMLKDKDRLDVDLSDEIAEKLPLFETKRKVTTVEDGKKVTCFATNFLHKTMQDFLAVLQLCEINFTEFRSFIEEEDRRPFVQELLFGIFFDRRNMEGILDMAQVLDGDKKRAILKTQFRDIVQLQRSKGSKMAIYALVNECKDEVDDIVHEYLRRLQVHGERLDTDAIWILSSLAGRAGNLEVMELSSCRLTDDNLKVLYRFLNVKEVKICLVNIRGNAGILFKNTALAEICRHCKTEELDVSDCNLDNEKAQRLSRMFKNIQLIGVGIGNNPELGEVGFQAVGELVRKSSATKLSADRCSLNEGKMKRLRKSLKGTPLRTLDVRNNKNMGVQTMAVLGMIVHDCNAEEVNVSGCNSTNKEIRNFQESLDKYKMRILDVSAEKSTSASGKEIVAISRLLPHVTEELRMTNWEISERCLKLFKDKINASACPDLKIYFGPMGEHVLTRQMNDEQS